MAPSPGVFLVSKSQLQAGVAVCAFLGAVAPERAPAEWVQLVPIGRFDGKDGRGPYIIRDKAHAQQVVAATLAYHRGADPVIDYDHQTDFGVKPDVGGTAPASGWMKEFQVRDDGIYARVEWTPAAQARLEAREYRYLSPVFTHNQKGVVGVILRAGLVNAPNLQLAAVAAQQDVPNPQGNLMDRDALIQALGLDENATDADIMAAVNSAQAARTQVSAIALAAGLTAEAKPQDVLTAVQSAQAKAKDPANPDPAKFVPADQVIALQTQLNALQDDRAREKAETAVDRLIEQGRLIPALRDWAIAQHTADPAKFEEFAGKAPVVLEPGEGQRGKEAAEVTLTAEDKAVCAQMGLAEDVYLAAKKEGL